MGYVYFWNILGQKLNLTVHKITWRSLKIIDFLDFILKDLIKLV